ncbi:D-alanyl-D-alanine carboxypeptidase [Kibdelosporangium phytohabitans]|nr:D-alanyl-D-alanine carboxypeptidase [Kibdelosporangium phytohabitans]
MSWAGAAGAMAGTGEDLNLFFAALLSGRLLPPAQLAEMKRTVPATLFPHAGHGLGLVGFPLSCGVDIWGHGGTLPGYRTCGGVTADGRAVNASVNQIAESPDGSIHVMRVVDTAVCSPS